MTYQGFGYVVDSCPTNETEFISAATRLNCSEDQFGRNQYTCVPNEDISALVEFCYSKIVGLYQKGHCLETFGNGLLDQISCNHFQAGCPEENFRGTDLYKFPDCSRINNENRCFYADPSCSKRREINHNNSSTPVGGIINSTMSILTTETGIVVEESSYVGVIIGSTLCPVLILFLVLAIIFWKRRMSKKRKYKEIPLKIVSHNEENRTQDTCLMTCAPIHYPQHYKWELKDDFREQYFNDQQVKWLWRYKSDGRPDIVRSCIGLYPHSDIYVKDNMAYRKSIHHHEYKSDIRCLLYCLLLLDEYTLHINDDAYRVTLNRLRDRYFNEHVKSDAISTKDFPDEVIHTVDCKITFASDSIRHDVMYAFVTECLLENSDLEFFLNTASRDVISEYCRSWEYERREGERCLFVPSIPENMYDLFINKLQLDIIAHCTVSDQNIHGRINKHFGVPREVLQWEQEARERYVKYARRGTQTVHHARGMIVGCAGAGKTTLLKRLLNPENKEIPNVPSTEGLEVHEEIFEICDGKLKVKSNTDKMTSRKNKKKPRKTNNSLEEEITKTVSFFDFGGQCAYYACHQIYLTRRAFYVVVVDASKRLYQVVDKNTCDQEDTVFNGWTYKDYFEFWLKSIHTYCSQPTEEEENTDVVIVVTHWENRIDQDTKTFNNILRNSLSPHSNLGQYIGKNSLFYAQFPLEPLEELEKFLADLALSSKWREKIPYEWEFLNQEIEENRKIKRILPFSDVCKRMPVNETEKNESTKDMLRYYHDAGKVLYFNEEGLNEIVIIDVQWFVDAFKNIITDANHVKGIDIVKRIWDEYYTTGNLQAELLSRIWEKEDEKLMKSLIKKKVSFEKGGLRFLMYHKEVLLSYMQRLGLIVIGETCHYVPCMNKKPFADQQMEIIKKAPLRSSVLVFLFDFLPFFLFYRLVVKLMASRTFQVLKNKYISCLYKNAALFSYKNHNIAVAVTSTTIQLQVYQPEPRLKLKKKVALFIRESIEQVMEDITTTFHKHLSFRIGFICNEEEDQILGKEIADNFIDETKLTTRKTMTCPNHQMENSHTINPKYLQDFWKLSTSGHLCACAIQGRTPQEPF